MICQRAQDALCWRDIYNIKHAGHYFAPHKGVIVRLVDTWLTELTSQQQLKLAVSDYSRDMLSHNCLGETFRV